MAMVHDASQEKSWWVRLLTSDFCPWANRFVYWLKEPVGWFISAAVASAIIGYSVSPIGWTMAASLSVMIVIGMAWPWIAVRAVACSLTPEEDRVHEDDACHFKLSVLNRLPLPVWGLAIEGYLDRQTQTGSEETPPTVALAFVKGLSKSTYRFAVRPRLRGHYPQTLPLITCSFPFGIWTAKKQMREVSGMTVWPKVYPVAGRCPMSGRVWADLGEGNRSGPNGDFIGVRDYRNGDAIKHVNWVATARADRLIVTERNAPQCPTIDVWIDTGGRSDLPTKVNQQLISDRIRVAASLLVNLHQSAIPTRIQIGTRSIIPRRGPEGLRQLLDALADVPLEGSEQPLRGAARSEAACLTVSSDKDGDPIVCSVDPSTQLRQSSSHRHRRLDRSIDLGCQLASFWTGGRDAKHVA
ncbi:DUF58 domain-containing protein [Roseiconus lacunae]|uniref:DUF58 domain-containing protein n=1 Tax=Roseiconus lacunae TaxID=2605694 RepID=UPI001E5D510B|nr:DUF58 domain-containing protein [Roseiconus lacunae]MCD0460771.1 DUF58 domain-containing protein [Roseiconus lacunae]